MKRASLSLLTLFAVMALSLGAAPKQAAASCCGCHNTCTQTSYTQSKSTIEHITQEFINHRKWMISEFWEKKLLPAMMLMTEQLTASAMFQVQIIGSFFDAKHQLETQRLFQQLAAQAHKDYQPSEGLCTIGTNVRSLAASQRNATVTSEVLQARSMARLTLNADGSAVQAGFSDEQSRFAQFIKTYCNPLDNARGLDLICGSGSAGKRLNKDIDYTQTFDAPMTLELDFTGTNNTPTADEEDIFALAANLFGHEVPTAINRDHLSVDADKMPSQGANLLQDSRATQAKRSVALTSFVVAASEKAQGEKEVQPYLYKLLEELGIPKDDIKTMLGERPSYYAQMEVLTKKLYQDPNFYADLYDKPANVQRKEVAMQAIDLMQKRDIFRSLLRSEANLSLLLETAVAEEQRVLQNEVNPGSGR